MSFMLSCKDVTHLISQQLDMPLPWRRRVQMRMHLAICALCRRYQRQVRALHEILRGHPEKLLNDSDADAHLPPPVKERIKQVIRARAGDRYR